MSFVGSNVNSGSTSTRKHKYVYDLPYFDRKELCRILDENNEWEALGGGMMGYNSSELHEFGRALYRGASPTDTLLTAWGSQNHSILELFILLGKLNHFRGMRLLASYVDPKYHVYIRDPDENATQELIQLQNQPEARPSDTKAPNSPDVKKGETDKKKADNADTKAKFTSMAQSYGMLPQIPYEQLVAATNNWDRRFILGKGGFGIVFRGQWKSTDVAIKRMEQRPNHDNIESQMKQSLGELRFLNAYRHDNILPLYGYSLEGDHPCLVYQYMPNGSLEDRLLCRQKTPPLDWILRYRITRGVACGIQFLHSITDKPLIHGDIKSANILLDKNFEAKVGDFGLAREMQSPAGASYVKVSRVHGTRPYLPDEYLRSKKLSPKVDTYSFGIMLFEIATGQRAYEDTRPKKFLRDMFEDTEVIDTLRDPRGGHDGADIFNKLVALGRSCTKRLAKERPTMVQVLKSLDAFFSQPISIIRSTVSSHVTGIPLLFETPSRVASLAPTSSSIQRLSPEIRIASDMRAGSPWTPSLQLQQGLQPHTNQSPFLQNFHQLSIASKQPPNTDSLGSSPRRSPSYIPSPSPQFQTNPVTLSDNNQQSNVQHMNIPCADKDVAPNTTKIPQFVEFMPPQKQQPIHPQPRLPVPVTNQQNVVDDYFPMVLPDSSESTDCDVDQDKRDFDCSQGPATVIPLITELGIKDADDDEK